MTHLLDENKAEQICGCDCAQDSNYDKTSKPAATTSHELLAPAGSRDKANAAFALQPSLPELLAPAGSREAFLAALQNGADAIYLGVQDFNARRNAANFSITEIRELSDLAHLADAKLFLTLNIAILPNEFRDAMELARQAWYAGIDAVIVQDIGLMVALARELPQLELHVSTQTNAHSSAAVSYLASIGASRVTLARELSVEKIAAIASGGDALGTAIASGEEALGAAIASGGEALGTAGFSTLKKASGAAGYEASGEASSAAGFSTLKKATCPIEVFAHGALCVCYSGNCLMSSLIGQRSANRGLCAQPCRLPYQLIDSSTGRRVQTEGPHLLSPLDLATVDMLPQLVAAGVAALKIEGRMKDAAYVGTVTRVYRQALDALCLGSRDDSLCESDNKRESDNLRASDNKRESDSLRASENKCESDSVAANREASLKSLKTVYTRGFTQAYLSGERGNAMMGYNQPNNRGVQISPDEQRDDNLTTDHLFSGNNGWRKVLCKVHLSLNEPAKVTFFDILSGHCASATGEAVQTARSRALSEADIIEHVGRVGGTIFSICEWDIMLASNVGMSFSALHALRREALDALSEKLLAPWHSRRLKSAPKKSTVLAAAKRGAPFVAALVRDASSERAARKAGATAIYAHALSFNLGEKPLNVADSLNRCATTGTVGGAIGRMGDSMVGEVGAGVRVGAEATKKAASSTAMWLPAISSDTELAVLQSCISKKTDGFTVVANNLGELAIASMLAKNSPLNIQIGPSLSIYNNEALEHFAQEGACRAWIGPELSLSVLEQIAPLSPLPLGITVFGAQEMMITEHCVLMAQGPCDRCCDKCSRRAAPRFLEDRKGYRFPVRTDNCGRSHIYNAVSLDITHEIPRLLALGVTGFLVDCTLLNTTQISAEVERAARACRLAANGTGQLSKREGTTTGHLFRGVL
ncbi:MAG: U32 family peptidase [Coriobacteriales bacterium]|jgi:putative protease|nr:U32 family peptidase [Coriobacteriales bacterium]